MIEKERAGRSNRARNAESRDPVKEPTPKVNGHMKKREPVKPPLRKVRGRGRSRGSPRLQRSPPPGSYPYTCIFAHVQAGMHAHTYTCAHTHINAHIYTHMYTHTSMHAHMHTCTGAHTHAYLHIHAYLLGLGLDVDDGDAGHRPGRGWGRQTCSPSPALLTLQTGIGITGIIIAAIFASA